MLQLLMWFISTVAKKISFMGIYVTVIKRIPQSKSKVAKLQYSPQLCLYNPTLSPCVTHFCYFNLILHSKHA